MQLHRVTLKCESSEWKWFCAMSDIHFGSVFCDKLQVKKDLEEARKRNARINIIGDVFDLLLPQDHKRFKPSMLIPELQGREDIIDEIISLAVEIFKPYVDLIDLISPGNHEESILKYHSTDVIGSLIRRLNQYLKEINSEHRIKHGGYIGYLQYVFSRQGEGGRSVNILYFHGKGGESPVTKGMIDSQRMKTNFIYDIHLFGHKHNKFADATMNVMPTGKGAIDFRPCRNIQCGTYQKTYGVERNVSSVSFGEQRAFAPKDMGCAFFKVRFLRGKISDKLEIRVEI